jgi:hypothetical protein
MALKAPTTPAARSVPAPAATRRSSCVAHIQFCARRGAAGAPCQCASLLPAHVLSRVSRRGLPSIISFRPLRARLQTIRLRRGENDCDEVVWEVKQFGRVRHQPAREIVSGAAVRQHDVLKWRDLRTSSADFRLRHIYIRPISARLYSRRQNIRILGIK